MKGRWRRSWWRLRVMMMRNSFFSSFYVCVCVWFVLMCVYVVCVCCVCMLCVYFPFFFSSLFLIRLPILVLLHIISKQPTACTTHHYPLQGILSHFHLTHSEDLSQKAALSLLRNLIAHPHYSLSSIVMCIDVDDVCDMDATTTTTTTRYISRYCQEWPWEWHLTWQQQ